MIGLITLGAFVLMGVSIIGGGVALFNKDDEPMVFPQSTFVACCRCGTSTTPSFGGLCHVCLGAELQAQMAASTQLGHQQFANQQTANSLYSQYSQQTGTLSNGLQALNSANAAMMAQLALYQAPGWLASQEPAIDADQPNTLGWRFWHFDPDAMKLVSPIQHVIWHDAELRVERWDESEAVRGVAGIHARLVPVDWTKAASSEVGVAAGFAPGRPVVTGIVERFGKYVLGEAGWRAEWVIIRKLYTINPMVAWALEQAYPEVEIILGKEEGNGHRQG